MNSYNPDGKDIRFIDSHYQDKFRLPDGGYIQIDYGSESVVKRCSFIDEYHTQIGSNVFHICQFAELMERNGNVYFEEPETDGTQSAWKVGRNVYLQLEVYEDGMDYYLYDEKFREFADGYFDNPNQSLNEVRNQILAKHGLENRDLVKMDFDFLMQNVQKTVSKEMAERRENTMSQEKIERWNEINGNDSSQDKLTAFLDSATDSYAILQLRRTEDTVMERFESLSSLHRQGREPEFDHYEVVYCSSLPSYANQNVKLEGLYEKFNLDHPADFRGHSLSVSDIVALKTDGVVSFHYVDSVGFAELPDFMRKENYLKNAEMALEDDFGMIDGVINNGKAPAVEERRSVLEQLRDKPPVTETPVKSSRHSKERDLE